MDAFLDKSTRELEEAREKVLEDPSATEEMKRFVRTEIKLHKELVELLKGSNANR